MHGAKWLLILTILFLTFLRIESESTSNEYDVGQSGEDEDHPYQGRNPVNGWNWVYNGNASNYADDDDEDGGITGRNGPCFWFACERVGLLGAKTCVKACDTKNDKKWCWLKATCATGKDCQCASCARQCWTTWPEG